MLLGAIADDFTGAGDLAATLAREGLATVQLIGVPGRAAPAAAEAGVVALKTRSVPAAEAVARSLEALDWLLAQGCRQILFKYCSTFDSTPEGNIGPVGEALLARLGGGVAVACPAFPANGRTVYRGHLFVGDALLSESGMEKHPLTPMTDPNLVRFLARQTQRPVGLVPWATVAAGPEAIRARLAVLEAEGVGLAIADAISDADLRTLGAALAEARLVTGGSGIALGLPANFRAAGLAGGRVGEPARVAGPAAVLSGSCSVATRGQVARYAATAPALEIDPDAVMAGATTAETATAFALARLDERPLLYSSADPERVASAQSRHGRERLAHALETTMGEIARRLVAAGVRNLVVAGGETSGAVVSALGVETLEIGREIAPGVPVTVSRGATDLGLVLKSGNFGGPDFFAEALAALVPSGG